NIITIINEVDQKRAIKIMVKLLARQDDTNIRNNSFKDLKQISQKSGKDMDNLIIENWEPSYQIYLYDVARALRKVGSSKSKEYTPLFLEALKNYPPDPISPGEGINGSPLSLEIIYFLSQRTAEIKDDLLKIFDNPPNDKVKNAVVFLLMSQAESIAPEIVKKLQIPPELFIDNMMSNYLGFNNGTISNTYSNEYHFTAHHAHDPGFSINIFNNTIKRGDYLDLIIKGNMTRHGKYARFVVQVFDANDDGDHPSVSNPINITKDYSVVRISLKDKIKVPKKINFLLVTDNGSCEVDIKDDIRIMIDYNYFYNLLIDISKLTHKSVDDLIAENWSAEYPIFLPEVARAIGNKQKSEFIPQLFIAANDGGNPAREEAKKALNKMAEKTSDYYFDIVSKGNVKNESLVIKLLDPYWKYIYSSDNRANRILVKLLDDKDKDIRNTIQNTLLQYHKDKPQEIDDLINGHLVPYLSNLDYERPIENYLILEAIKRANISDQLILKDKLLLTAKNINEEKNEYSLEAAAYSILIKLGEPPKGGGRELREHLNKIVVDKEKDLQLRKIAAKLIGDIGSEDGEKALKIVLGVGFFNRRDKDKELCKFSLESIKKIRKNKK
ncbi:MAG: hypothetical protein NT030_07685, partial [Candidatus Saganbacteria bacterium]|nr:hypothetical protein [Candidatus Saganbacteria bacterium]